MREIFSKKEKCAAGGILMYSLISTKQKCLDFGEYESYGISITYECSNSNETEIIEDISTDLECVKRLFLKITESEVYPVSLAEIVYDYLCS